MKKILFYSLLAAISLTTLNISASAQKEKRPTFNHLALYIFDLNKSAEFYKNVIQLEVIPEPFHDGKHVWFKMGEHSQLHVIQGAADVVQHDRNTHFCFTVPSVEKFIAHLNQLNIPYTNSAGVAKTVTIRTDGIKQIYFQDPDNYWIEVNDDRY